MIVVDDAQLGRPSGSSKTPQKPATLVMAEFSSVQLRRPTNQDGTTGALKEMKEVIAVIQMNKIESYRRTP